MTAALAEQAAFERDRRVALFNERKPIGLIADLEAAVIDCQCWHAIAEWLETDRFQGFPGGAAPDSPGAPWISWPELERAADQALTNVAAQCDRLFASENAKPGEYEQACVRRARLTCIHRLVQRRRESIDIINAELRKPREGMAA